MKYLTYQLNKYGEKIKLEPLYLPEASISEPLYIRIIAGNIRPAMMSVSLEGDAESDKIPLREVLRTVWEGKLERKHFLTLRENEKKPFKVKIFLQLDKTPYKAQSNEEIEILGTSFGLEHQTEVSMLFDVLNQL